MIFEILKLKPLLILFTLISLTQHAQMPSVLKYERRWAILHPFAAIKIKKISSACENYYSPTILKSKLDSFANGGKLDAYRHIFFIASFAQKVKASKIIKLGIAHEKSNYVQFQKYSFENGETPDSLSTVMDLQNNQLGVKIGSNQKKIDL